MGNYEQQTISVSGSLKSLSTINDWLEVGVTVPKKFTKNEQKSDVLGWKSNFFGETLNSTQQLMIKSWTAHSAQNGPIFAHF